MISQYYFVRSLLTSNVRYNTAAEKEKSSDGQTPPVADGKLNDLDEKSNAVLEDLNKKVLELTQNNNDLTVIFYHFIMLRKIY